MEMEEMIKYLAKQIKERNDLTLASKEKGIKDSIKKNLKDYIRERMIQPHRWLSDSDDLDDDKYVGECLGEINAYQNVIDYINKNL